MCIVVWHRGQASTKITINADFSPAFIDYLYVLCALAVVLLDDTTAIGHEEFFEVFDLYAQFTTLVGIVH